MNNPELSALFLVAQVRGTSIADALQMTESEFLGWLAFHAKQMDAKNG